MPATLPPTALHFSATLRNRDPIRTVLRDILPASGTILEIASGSGEHISYFASYFKELVWQPTECDPTLLASIAAHAAAADASSIKPPLMLDVASHPWPVDAADAVIAINMIHIAPWSACLHLMTGAGAILPPDAPLYVYGPFLRDGGHTAPSNAAFDRALRAQDPLWGLRDLDAVAAAATAEGLSLDQVIDMPANNLSVVFRKTS